MRFPKPRLPSRVVAHGFPVERALHALQALSQNYWNLLGRPGVVTSLLPSPPPPPAPALRASEEKRTETTAAVVGSVCGALLLLGAVVVVWRVRRARRRRHRSLMGRVLAPGPGLQTTLVITDVQVWGGGAVRGSATMTCRLPERWMARRSSHRGPCCTSLPAGLDDAV